MKDAYNGYKIYSLTHGWGEVYNTFGDSNTPISFSCIFPEIGKVYYEFTGRIIDNKGNIQTSFRDVYWDVPEIEKPEISEKNKQQRFSAEIYVTHETLREIYYCKYKNYSNTNPEFTFKLRSDGKEFREKISFTTYFKTKSCKI